MSVSVCPEHGDSCGQWAEIQNPTTPKPLTQLRAKPKARKGMGLIIPNDPERSTTKPTPVPATGRIRPGEIVTLDNTSGRWRVLSISRAGAHLEAVRSFTRKELRGVAYSRMTRSNP